MAIVSSFFDQVHPLSRVVSATTTPATSTATTVSATTTPTAATTSVNTTTQRSPVTILSANSRLSKPTSHSRNNIRTNNSMNSNKINSRPSSIGGRLSNYHQQWSTITTNTFINSIIQAVRASIEPTDIGLTRKQSNRSIGEN
ncbi:hypothetical protein PS15p_204451 [Mucor circinelloides]